MTMSGSGFICFFFFAHSQAFGVTGATSDSIQVSYACGTNCPSTEAVDHTPLIVGLVVGLGGGLILILVVTALLVRRRIVTKRASYMIPNPM